MNICDYKNDVELVAGHLYRCGNSEVCIYTTSRKMVRLSTGSDSIQFTDPSLWKDVTDQYCLKKV